MRHLSQKYSIRFFILLFSLFFLIFIILSLYKRNIWDGKSRLTLIILSEEKKQDINQPIVIFSINPKEKNANYLLIPGNLLLEVPYEYGEYFASSIYQLGELDKKRNGLQLLAKSIENTFGLPIDGYLISNKLNFPLIINNESELKRSKSIYFSFTKGIWSILNYSNKWGKIKTNLSFGDKFRLWNFVRKIRIDQIDYYNLDTSDVVDNNYLPDGTSVKKLNSDLYDTLFRDKFYDPVIRLDNLSVEVVNTTQKIGLAKKFSRILEFLGANVISNSTNNEKIEKPCVISFSGSLFSKKKLVIFLKKYYHCHEKIKEKENIADIKIELGEEFDK